jgi:small-conductance mechanosensitive channel
MKRLWYVDIQKREDAFTIRVFNVFDGCEAEEPMEVRVPGEADVEAVLRAIKPLAFISRRYMEINGLGSLLRIASLTKMSLEAILARVRSALDSPSPSVVVTSFLTRKEISGCLSRRANSRSFPAPDEHGRAE